MKKFLVVTLFLFSTQLFGTPNEKFVTVSLPHGVSLEIPRLYRVLSQKESELIDTATQSIVDLAGVDPVTYNKPFSANYFIDNKTVSIVNILYYPDIEFTQADIANFTPEDIDEVDNYLRESNSDAYKSMSSSVLEWYGTERVKLNGLHALRTSFFRDKIGKSQSSVVTFIRVISAEESFNLTFSYQKSLEFFLKPITERMIMSVKKNQSVSEAIISRLE
ncbi:hypothetical protein [Alteromonas sp. BZK5]|uniref:hypothetical protein n=1 Tax=Alteromonas sp. BZK5 TaxID=1904459 RepID=UPI00165341D0|nr:hypothetical protein [Alteromonas sp. BZK5]MBC6987929.1 hypothetical protein [Alteromonas sp. BZK5]